MAYRYKIRTESTTTGTLNPALNVLAFADAGAPGPESAAQVIAYMSHMLWQMGTSDSGVFGLDVETTPGSGIWLPVPFPTDEYDLLAAEWLAFNGTAEGIITEMSYGNLTGNFAGKTSSGRGDSLCVNTRALGIGRNGNGRHFLPFLTRVVVTDAGLINPATSLDVVRGWQVLLENREAFTNAHDLIPSIWSDALGAMAPIVAVTPATAPSRLRSRLR